MGPAELCVQRDLPTVVLTGARRMAELAEPGVFSLDFGQGVRACNTR